MSVEVYALDLDEEVLSHLANPESARTLWAEHVTTDLIEDDEIADMLLWQYAHMREHKQPATPDVLADQFDLEEINAPQTAVGDLLDRLRDRYMKNHAREHMEKISKAYKEHPANVLTVLPQVSREIQRIAGKPGESYGNGDYPRAIERYDKSVMSGLGPSFGFKELDEHYGGVRGVTFGLAPPKTFKSWIYGANSAIENIKNGVPVAFASLEMPAHEMFLRMLFLASGVPWWKYVKGRVQPADKMLLEEAAEIIDGMGLFKIVKPESGHRTIDEIAERALDMGAQYLIIDQLQYVETDTNLPLGGCKPQEYWKPLNRARDLSDHLPMMILHQFNRTVQFADSMPDMQAAKGAAAIEEVATLMLGMWANKEMRRSHIVEIGSLAARNVEDKAWHIGVELGRGCEFNMVGEAIHDDDK